MTTNHKEPERQGKDDASEDHSQDSVKLLTDSVTQGSASTLAHTVMGNPSTTAPAGAEKSSSLFHPGQSLHSDPGQDGTDTNAEVISQGQDAEQPQKAKRKRNKRKNKAAQKPQSNMNADSNSQQDSVQNLQKQHDAQLDFTPLKDVIHDSFFDDQDSSEDEGMPDYKIGGYHPVHVGEILLDRYVIIQKLGWGHFSTVWLTKDLKFNSYVAIKVQKSAQHYLEAAYDEVEILNKVSSNWQSKGWAKSVDNYYKNDPELMAALKKYGMSGETSHCVQLLNSFIHHGPNGKHFVMVFEILGVNFLEIIKRYDYKGVPIPLVRKLARQCLIGLDYMHRQCKIIHTDFKPENVVIGLREDEVSEISKTGQLTTTKMFKDGNYIKQLNMKVAGTLPGQIKPKQTQEEKDKQEERLAKLAEIQPANYDGLTSKQKKNLKKKLQKKRKKLDQTNSQCGADKDDDVKSEHDESDGPKDLDKINVAIDTEAIVKEGQEKHKQRVKAITDSLDRLGAPPKMNNLLDDKEEKKQDSSSSPRENRRGPRINEDVQVKICDMGNGCWTYYHFTPEIQTRQYRSPEVIIGADYNTSADVWSFACTIFEMVTGDFLFEPRKGSNYDKDDDHLAQMMELLGRMPTNLALSGKNSRKFFNSKGNLRRISGLCYWPLRKVLTEKYLIKEQEANELSNFLMPMLAWHHDRRATAEQMLKHPWLNMPPNYKTKHTEQEFDIMKMKKELKHGADYVTADLLLDDPREEMNILVESDPENYEPDSDDSGVMGGYSQSPGRFNDDLDSEEFDIRERKMEKAFEVNKGGEKGERSLERSREGRARLQERKKKEAKIKNSFTGPYPLDPTDFNHNDKGANVQFSQAGQSSSVLQ